MSQLMSGRFDFFGSEARRFYGGVFAFVDHLAATEMVEYGAIRPFSYECEPSGWDTFKLTISETGRAIRSDAQRALVRAKARNRKKRR